MGSYGEALLRRMYDFGNAGDLERLLTTLHPQIELRMSGVFPGLESVYWGHDGFRRFWREFIELWVHLVTVPQSVEDLGDRALVLWTFEGEGRDGLGVRRDGAHIAHFKDDLVVSLQTYGDWASARQAAQAEH